MLTVLENLKETMKLNGTPDRFVNSCEFVNVVFATNYYMGDYPLEPGKEGYDQYGVLWRFPEGQMDAFPVHDAQHKLMDDVTALMEGTAEGAQTPDGESAATGEDAPIADAA